MMKNLSEQSVDELQKLHDRIGRILIARLTDRARELDKMHARLPLNTRRRNAKKRSSKDQSSAYRQQTTV
jgi:hypothetical protein